MANGARLRIIAALAVIGITLAGCASHPGLREMLDEVPAKHLAYYQFDPTTAIPDRLGSIPPGLLELYSRVDGVEYRPYEPTPDERRRLAGAIAALPARHQEVLGRRLIAIFFIENFTGSGMADYVLGPNDELYSVLVLHPRVFRMSAAELIGLRATSAFRDDDPDSVLEVGLDAAVSALEYIVLHESTHIVDYAERHTPCVEPSLLELTGESPRETPFTDAVWAGYGEVAREFDFPHRGKLRYYGLGGEPLLSIRELASAYSHLARTPFVSLYASANWAEDFAEYVTFYYLVRVRGYSYALRVRRAGESVVEFEPMEAPSVLERARYLDPDLLAPPALARIGSLSVR